MKIYGLIGTPLGHSFSQAYFRNKFIKENITDTEYILFDIKSLDSFTTLVKETPGLAGLNVTIPYKKEIIPYLDELAWPANEIEAVNTIKITRHNNDVKLCGYNTDVFGFETLVAGIRLENVNQVMVLGSGGSSSMVNWFFRNKGIKTLLVSRNPKDGFTVYSGINSKMMEETDIIVNTTPLGMFPGVTTFPEIPYEHISGGHTAIDLIYNPEETVFLQKCRLKGAVAINGLKMLHAQADRSWKIWQE